MSNIIEMAQTDPEKAKKRLNQMRHKAQNEGFWMGVFAMLKPGDLCVECGAGVGERADKIVAQGADLIAFEADPNAFAVLQTKFGQSEKVKLVQGVATNDKSTRALYRKTEYNLADKSTLSLSTIQPVTDKGYEKTDQTVETFNLMDTLKDVLKTHDDIAVLYIDNRGSELEIVEEILRSEIIKKIRLFYVVSYGFLRTEEKERYQVIQDFSKNHPEWNFILERA